MDEEVCAYVTTDISETSYASANCTSEVSSSDFDLGELVNSERTFCINFTTVLTVTDGSCVQDVYTLMLENATHVSDVGDVLETAMNGLTSGEGHFMGDTLTEWTVDSATVGGLAHTTTPPTGPPTITATGAPTTGPTGGPTATQTVAPVTQAPVTQAPVTAAPTEKENSTPGVYLTTVAFLAAAVSFSQL